MVTRIWKSDSITDSSRYFESRGPETTVLLFGRIIEKGLSIDTMTFDFGWSWTVLVQDQ